MKSKITIGKDLKGYLSKEKNNMAESHLEAWKDRYWTYGGNKKRLIEDLYSNHDPSLEIEMVKEELNRELTTDEETFIISQFNKEVLKVWQNR